MPSTFTHLPTRPLIPNHCPFCGALKASDIAFSCHTFRTGYGNNPLHSEFSRSLECKDLQISKLSSDLDLANQEILTLNDKIRFLTHQLESTTNTLIHWMKIALKP